MTDERWADYSFEEIVAGKGNIKELVPGYWFKELSKHIVCKDGTTLSVQASENHYCRPRKNNGPYNCVEVGYPSAKPPEKWAKFFDGAYDDTWEETDGTGSVYGYVPIELVQKYIESHGGEVL